MKKSVKIILIIIVILIAIILIVPTFFKSKIAEIIKTQANKRLTAELNFEGISLNLFEHFPDFTLSINNLSIINKAPFEGDTLLSAEAFEATINIWSVIGGDKIIVEGLSLEEPKIAVYVLEDSTANYNIYSPDTSKAGLSDTSKTDFSIALKEYSIDDGKIIYIDQTSDLVFAAKGFNHSGSGNFSQDNFNIDTKTIINKLTLEKNGVTYLNDANAELDLIVNADIPSKKFTLKENELRINNLQLKFDGTVQKKDEDLVLDLKFSSPRTDFKDFVSLIPAVYSENFEDVESSGKMIFNGEVQGTYNETHLPAFHIDLKVENGSLKYPDLESSIKNIQINLSVDNPGGIANATVINLKKFHSELSGNPLDASMIINLPQQSKTGTHVNANVKGKVDLGDIKNALPMKGVTELDGIINADFSFEGRLTKDVNYKNINAEGNIVVKDILYASENLSQKLMISSASLNLNPQFFKLNNFNMKLGESDLKANGSLNNVLSYFLSEGTLIGEVNLTSNYFNINPLMEEGEQGEASGENGNLNAMEVPPNINFTANIRFNKLIYDNLTLENINGEITVKDQRLIFDNVTANLLGGSFTVNGFYDTKNSPVPKISLNIAINSFDIQDTYKSFVTVERFVPLAKYINGEFGANLKLNTTLNEKMMPVWDSFNSNGSLTISNAEISGFKPFEIIGDKLSIAALKDPSIDKAKTSYEIKNGRFYLSPLSYEVLGYPITFSGSNGIDKSLDYTMAVNVPIGKVKSEINQAVSGLLNEDINLISADKVKVSASIMGSIDDPKVSLSAASAAEKTVEKIESKVKEKVNEKIEEKKEEVKEKIESKADTLKEQLKKKAEEKIKDIFKNF